MNATTKAAIVRVARYTGRRSLATMAMGSSSAVWPSSSFAGPVACAARLRPREAADARTTTKSTPWFRGFSSARGGGDGGAPTATTPPSTEERGDDDDAAPLSKPIVVDLDSHSNADTASYDPYEIMKSFRDTSYYYPPSEETDPKYLASKYEGMTNEELLDTSTIRADEVAAPVAGGGTPLPDWDSLMHSPPIRDKNAALPKGTLVGTVLSTKMQKTVNVSVDRYKIHPKYKKRIRYSRKFMAHDEHEVARDGDTVLIIPSQRISKKKHFVLKEIVRAKGQL